jgi:hypothetical protein
MARRTPSARARATRPPAPKAAPQAPPGARRGRESAPIPAAPRSPRQAAFATMREAGVPLKTAAAAAGYTGSSLRSTVYTLDKQRRKGLLSSLTPLAKRNVREVLKARADGEVVKWSDKLAAAKMVLDREEPPVVRVEGRHVHGHAVLTPEKKARLAALLGRREPPPEPAEGPPALAAGPPGKPNPPA